MSVYGMIVVGGDYEGRIGELTKLLNNLRLHGSDGATFIKHRNKIIIDTFEQEFPTVFPEREFLVFEDGRRINSNGVSYRLKREWEEIVRTSRL